MFDQILYILISMGASFGIFCLARYVIRKKLGLRHNSQKLVGIVSFVIVMTELVFVGISFGLFDFALEMIASIGVGLVVFGIGFQHQLKNVISGIWILFTTDIDIGDIIHMDGRKGAVIEIYLTKTIALTDNGEKIIIPNRDLSKRCL